MIISTNKGGLSNRIKSIVHCISYANIHNINYNVYWKIINENSKEVHKLNCSFSKLFQNDIEHKNIIPEQYIKNLKYKNFILNFYPILYIDNKDNIPQNFNTFKTKAKSFTYLYPDKKDLIFMYNKIPESLKTKYIKYFKVLKPIPDLQYKINNFSKKFNNKTISLHIRSWKKKGEWESRGKHLFNRNKFENIITKYKDHNFFLSTDNSDVKEYFLDKYNVLTYPRKTNINTSRNTEKGIQEDLIELYLLSKNKIIIGSELSTFTEVAWWLGGCTKDIYIL